jgi:hypothetical protein
LVDWLHYCGAEVRQNIMAVEEEVIHLIVARKQRETGRNYG